MGGNFFEINTKTVQLSRPYVAPTYELIGRDREMKKILAAWMGGTSVMPLSPFLLGEPGVGKTGSSMNAPSCARESFTSFRATRT